jgi:hypothetical protein
MAFQTIGKRGDVDVQFNWMFVIIIGALILLLAVSFVTSQKKNADTIISTQIIRFTNSVITHSGSTSGKTEFITLQKDIGTTCSSDTCRPSGGCTSELYVMPKSLQASISTSIEPIFSSSLISGQEMMTWTMDWTMPYRTTNFIYLTSDKARYIFVGEEGDPLMGEIYAGLPATMNNKERVTSADLDSIRDRNNYKVKLIFFNTDPILPASLQNLPAKEVSAVKIIPNSAAPTEIGSAVFYKKSGSGLIQQQETFYLGRASLYGAIFAEDSESYICNLKKALIRLGIVSELYQKKLVSLPLNPDLNPVCIPYYQSTIQPIDDIMDMLDPENDLMRNMQLADAQALYAASNQIVSTNNALKTKSCPVIY